MRFLFADIRGECRQTFRDAPNGWHSWRGHQGYFPKTSGIPRSMESHSRGRGEHKIANKGGKAEMTFKPQG